MSHTPTVLQVVYDSGTVIIAVFFPAIPLFGSVRVNMTVVLTCVCVCWLQNREIYITGTAPYSTGTVIYLCHFW